MKQVMSNGVVRTQAEDLDDRLSKVFGEKYSQYRKAWYKAGPNYIPSYPLHVDLELVDTCNLSCGFCPRNTKEHPNLPYAINTKAKLSDSLVDKFFKEVEKHSLPSINISIGEPLLDNRCLPIIKEFHGRGGVDSRVITNGILLDKYVDQIFDSGLMHLFVSLDAFSEETYRQRRGGGKGRYQQIVDNVLLIIKEKERRKSMFPIMRVSFVELETNEHEQKDFLEFWQNKVEVVDIQLRLHYNDFKGSQKPKLWNCMDPFRRLCIMANQHILPCCTFYGKTLKLADFETSSLTEAWEGKEMAKVRHDLLHDLNPMCLACQGC
jgi:sulfatase maturation enzyme AslB (radical SAM superfamily)